jgi:L-lactate utilization protein LutB
MYCPYVLGLQCTRPEVACCRLMYISLSTAICTLCTLCTPCTRVHPHAHLQPHELASEQRRRCSESRTRIQGIRQNLRCFSAVSASIKSQRTSLFTLFTLHSSLGAFPLCQHPSSHRGHHSSLFSVFTLHFFPH